MKYCLLKILLPIIILLHLGYCPGYNQSLNDMQQKNITTPQGKWSYLVSNPGSEAVLFIHGASSSNRIWQEQYPLTLSGYKTIFVDLLGYGASDKPESGYGLLNWLAGIELMLQTEGVDKVWIVGHSNGVIFAKEFYRAHPDRVAGLILLDGMLKTMISEPILAWMKAALDREDYEEFMAGNVERMPVGGLNEEEARVLKDDALKTPKRVSRAELDLVTDPLTWEELIIRCPVIIVHSNNPTWDENYLAWLSTIAPGHKLLEWTDAGHFIPLQFPDRLNQLIKEVVGQ